MKHKHCALSALFAVAVLGAPTASAQSGTHIMVTPGDIKWADVGSLPPGAKLAVLEGKMNEAGPITARLKFPADYKLPAHWHPATERVTVLSGTFNMGMGDQFNASNTHALVPGSLMVMEPGTKHFAWTKEETVVQLNTVGPWGIVYVNPADDPRKK